MPGLQSIPARLHSPQSVANAPLDPGTVIGGRYRIESRIGEGGMGYVLRARHLELDTLVAIKIVRPELATNVEAGERLLEESRAMASIHSEYIVGVHDAGRLPDGSQYLVLEYVDGPDLERVISAQGSLSSADTIAFALDACTGLGVAHALGIVHRDIKPENLLLATDANGAHRIKISDFGIAKRSAHLRKRALTLPTMALGSPCYMAPEQMRNASDIDGRADVWSLGVVIYEMCTGMVPFSASTPLEICTMVMSTSPRAPSEVRPGIAEGLERVIDGCLRREPAERYQTVGDVAHALSLVAVPAGAESRRLVSGLRPYDESPLGGGDSAAVDPRAEGRAATNERMFETRITLAKDRKKIPVRASEPPAPAPPSVEQAAPPRRLGRLGRLVASLAVLGALAVLGLAIAEPAAVARSFAWATSTVAARWRGHASDPIAIPVSLTTPDGASSSASMASVPVPVPVWAPLPATAASTAATTFDFEADARSGVVAVPAWVMPLEAPAAETAPLAERPSYVRVPTAPVRARVSDAYQTQVVIDEPAVPSEALSTDSPEPVREPPVADVPVDPPAAEMP